MEKRFHKVRTMMKLAGTPCAPYPVKETVSQKTGRTMFAIDMYFRLPTPKTRWYPAKQGTIRVAAYRMANGQGTGMPRMRG